MVCEVEEFCKRGQGPGAKKNMHGLFFSLSPPAIMTPPILPLCQYAVSCILSHSCNFDSVAATRLQKSWLRLDLKL